MPRQGELRAFHGLGAKLEADLIGGVHQHAVALVGEVERDIFVRELRGGAAVLIPDIHGLPVFHKRGKALAQPVDLFVHIHIHLHAHVPAVRRFHTAHVAVGKAGQQLAVFIEMQAELLFGEHGGQRSRGQCDRIAVLRDLQAGVVRVQRKLRALAAHALIIGQPD